MSVVTPEIRFFADCHWLMADNIILLKITPMLPYEWSNLRRLFDCKSTFETRSGPFDYWRIRLEFDGNLIHWTVSDGWWHPKTTTFDTDLYWDDLFSNGDPVETGAVIFQSQGAEDHPISLDLLIMSDGTWQPDGFDSDREGTAADVRGYLSQWTGDNR